MDKEDPSGVISIVWFTHSHPQETVRTCSAFGSHIMVCTAMELLQVVGRNHCLRAFWSLSPHRWSAVASGGSWHMHKRTHNDNLSAVFVPPHATILRDHLWSWVQTMAVTGREKEDDVASFEMRLGCFPGQAECVFYGQCREAHRPEAFAYCGVSNAVSGFYGFTPDRPHSTGYISENH